MSGAGAESARGSIGPLGERLVFVLSQPRSGSTMLQRILACHPEVHTVSEPWLMLSLLRLLSSRGNQDGLEAKYTRENVQAFLSTFPEGRARYLEAVRAMAGRLYSQALTAAGKQWFLDKTPRYAYCIPELAETFPGASFIFLLRNPLAVMCSVLRERGGYDPALLTAYVHRDDLLLVPRLLAEGIELLGSRALIVRYETLVAGPEPGVRRICEFLGLAFTPDLIEYGTHDLPRWRFGDKNVYEHNRPEASKAGDWKVAVRDPRTWPLADAYLRRLGPVPQELGYPVHDLARALAEARPGPGALWWYGCGLGHFGDRVGKFLSEPWRDQVATIKYRLGLGAKR